MAHEQDCLVHQAEIGRAGPDVASAPVTPKVEVPFVIATIRERKAVAYDWKPARKGSKKFKEFKREPEVITLFIYGLFDTHKDFIKAVKEKVDDWYDLRTIRFHEGGHLVPGRKGIMQLDVERD